MGISPQIAIKYGCSYRASCIVGTLILLATAHSALAIGLRTVAFSGRQAPGFEDGSDFADFDSAVLNNSGSVAFYGDLSVAAGARPIKGIWSEGHGQLALIARTGSPPTYAPYFANFGGERETPTLILNEQGRVSFDGAALPNFEGIWSEADDHLSTVAERFSPAPNRPASDVFTAFGFMKSSAFRHAFSDSGSTAFYGEIEIMNPNGSYTPDGQGLWQEGGGQSRIIVHSGDKTAGGISIGAASSIVINGSNQVAFLGSAGPDQAIWSEGSGALSLVAHRGSQAPGVTSGVTFATPSAPDLNNAGQVAFSASLSTPQPPISPPDNGIWEGTGDALVLIVRQGDVAPGAAPGIKFQSLSNPVINSSGKVAFAASLESLSGFDPPSVAAEGIWSNASGQLKLVARHPAFFPATSDVGTEVPGGEAGAHFIRFNDVSLNERGQVAFEADTATGPGFLGQGHGIWAQDVAGGLHLIARVGGQLDVDDGPGNRSRTRQLCRFHRGLG